jgi:hypothetical protein
MTEEKRFLEPEVRYGGETSVREKMKTLGTPYGDIVVIQFRGTVLPYMDYTMVLGYKRDETREPIGDKTQIITVEVDPIPNDTKTREKISNIVKKTGYRGNINF